jgi:pimeloyl-ACP methyl ester carboxylesterase
MNPKMRLWLPMYQQYFCRCRTIMTTSGNPAGLAPSTRDTSVHEVWLTLDGWRLRYLLCDQAQSHQKKPPGTPVPVVLIHGLLGYSFSWRHNLGAISRCGPVYAIDLPGVGFSDRPAQLDSSFRGLAGIVARSLDALGLETFDLIGTSHGGAVAVMLAAAVPRRVRHLVLAAPANPWSTHRLWLVKLLATRPGRIAFRGMSPVLPCLNGYFLRRMYGDPRQLTSETLAGYAAPITIPGTCEHLLRMVSTWSHDLRELQPAFTRITNLPTLLIWGRRDRAVPIESAEIVKQQFQQAELAVIEGAGHLPYEEVPEVFNRVVCEFLEAGN